MAILSCLPTIKVTIQIDGQNLLEYDDEDVLATQSLVSKYIEVSTGQQFRIMISSTGSQRPLSRYYLAWSLLIDGQYRFLREQTELEWCNFTFKHDKWIEGGAWYKKPLIFNELHLRESGQPLNETEKKAALGLGSIEIHVSRYRIKSDALKEAVRDNYPAVFEGTVPEKTIKRRAISHSVIDTRDGAFDGVAKARPLFTCFDSEPFATFRFKYRSRAGLESLGVIEKPLPAPASSDEDNIDHMNLEELRAWIRTRGLAPSKDTSIPEIKSEITDKPSQPKKRKFEVDLNERTRCQEPVIKKERVDVDLTKD